MSSFKLLTHLLIYCFTLAPGAVAAAVGAAEAPAAVVLLGKDHVALGGVVKVAGLEGLSGKGGEARVGGWGHNAAKIPAKVRLKQLG